MTALNTLHDLDPKTLSAIPPTYWYEGLCPQGGRVRLPRSALAEAIARELMQDLAQDDRYCREGKMYGVLIVELPSGKRQVLKAFSGLLHGSQTVAGWVPPIPGREAVALEEAVTLARLETIRQELITLQQIPQRQQQASLSQLFASRLADLAHQQQQQKQARQQQRQGLDAIADAALIQSLDDQSRQDGMLRRRLKQERDAALQPLNSCIEQADVRIQQLRQVRKQLSQQLQKQLQAAYYLTNFAGQSLSLQELTPIALPTGTGDCCAPKLLHYAATHRLKPMAMAEFWWGAAKADRAPGEFYGACLERCQPLMGFLLAGVQPVAPEFASPHDADSLRILYQDDWLIVVDKPAGLLSVPGRYGDRQDSVITRLQPVVGEVLTVHRLDQDTSGILLLARDAPTARHLSRQFQQRQVHKVYEAVLGKAIAIDRGTIELPLWSDPDDRPYQKVDGSRGKPSLTHFQVLAKTEHSTRVEFRPVTGRTHQLRVHAASGLDAPIWGDRLYGRLDRLDSRLDGECHASRLHLHAREIGLQHPQSGQSLRLRAETPF